MVLSSLEVGVERIGSSLLNYNSRGHHQAAADPVTIRRQYGSFPNPPLASSKSLTIKDLDAH
jgi:hypothetical protein